MQFCGAVRYRLPLNIETAKDVLVEIEPADSAVYKNLLSNPDIQPTVTDAVWLPSITHAESISKTPDSRVVLHFHGGAYVLNSPRDDSMQYGPKKLCEMQLADAVLCPTYRLSSGPRSSYPAQLQDAITAYDYLIKNRKNSPSQIILSGDSAGAHLAILLLRHLMVNPELGLPLPRALLLYSPWLDLTPEGIRINDKNERDYLTEECLGWGATTFTPVGVSPTEEFISPGLHSFKSPVPVWVQAGAAEVFYPAITRWVEEMRKAGSTIDLHDMKDMPHNIFVVGGAFALDDEVSRAIKAAKMFLETINLNSAVEKSGCRL
ncbi:uncharacterized protein TRUGW13939_02920 [Talaromyces rugulosus]|uniref:Alpha/beta hydrolase fold-3 domain-containing protein n=1 Tax=Talaromyces rugulosus TaxID=121627 RepID=A0A7H8QPJ2_TALRU|nr:uncharacterized protein TRUGW13939_02920 [Talaromyces rugulosus]QKX55822.1 hypothetical protein TRUGW13939_02920 [Talaromyces rugulosus]